MPEVCSARGNGLWVCGEWAWGMGLTSGGNQGSGVWGLGLSARGRGHGPDVLGAGIWGPGLRDPGLRLGRLARAAGLGPTF